MVNPLGFADIIGIERAAFARLTARQGSARSTAARTRAPQTGQPQTLQKSHIFFFTINLRLAKKLAWDRTIDS